MGRGTVALVWLVIVVGIGAAYSMGVTEGRKRAEGVAAERERDYQYRIDEVTKMLMKRAFEDDALEGIASDTPAADRAGRQALAHAPPSAPPRPGAAPIQSALASP